MDTTVLGRTNLTVSRMGLGCGGPSRLGLAVGKSEENAVAVVQKALDLGVNFIDTAESYGTETAVGKALAGGRRSGVILSTKVGPYENDAPCPSARMRERVEDCLKRLQTDYVDILHMHGVSVAEYPHVSQTLAPVLRELQTEGKIRFLGITEAFGPDPAHEMLRYALASDEDYWDVVMVGFNVLNQSARETVLPLTQQKNIGTLDMFAVRRALSNPAKLREVMASLVSSNAIKADAFDDENPLGFLLAPGPNGAMPAAQKVTEAAYRFCKAEPGMNVILSGTGNVAHLEENARALSQGPLPKWANGRLRTLFAGIDFVSGN